MIFAEGLTKYFDDFLAVDCVHLNVAQGQVMALLGKNGAGKTTTVRMLTSVLRPSNGQARVAGFDVVTQADQVRKAVGVLTEHHGLYNRMTAFEYLAFFASLYGISAGEAKKRILPLLESFELADTGKKRLGEFSKGMRQKLALVRALIHNPPVLLLDEPTSAMDPESARLVRDSIMQLRSSGRTILLCTHNLSEAEELADQVAIIQRGKIILNDELEKVKDALLGPPVFEVRLARSVNGWQADLPQGVTLTGRADDRLLFQVKDPLQDNPGLIRCLVAGGLEVVSVQALPRSLEQVFLDAVRQENGEVRRD